MVRLLPRKDVEAKGFAEFNNNAHLCVDIPDESFTITCKTSTGQKVTFAFVANPKETDIEGSHQCVDVQYHHDGPDKTEPGRPIQNVIVFGCGGTAFATRQQFKKEVDEMDKPTLTTVLLYPM